MTTPSEQLREHARGKRIVRTVSRVALAAFIAALLFGNGMAVLRIMGVLS